MWMPENLKKLIVTSSFERKYIKENGTFQAASTRIQVSDK